MVTCGVLLKIALPHTHAHTQRERERIVLLRIRRRSHIKIEHSCTHTSQNGFMFETLFACVLFDAIFMRPLVLVSSRNFIRLYRRMSLMYISYVNSTALAIFVLSLSCIYNSPNRSWSDDGKNIRNCTRRRRRR